jgi:outer membrane protein TolC
MRGLATAAAVLAATLIAGCTLEPDYRRPTISMPANWSAATAPTAAVAEADAWWRGFGDAQLLQLLNRAIDNSPDLSIAVDRVMEAQDMVKVAHSAKFPVVGFSGLPTDPISRQLRTTSSGQIDVDANIFELAFNASYELDFWNRVHNQETAAHADYRASLADAGTVQIGLLSSVARSYFDLRALDESLQLQQRRTDLARQRLNLARLRQNAGRSGNAPVTEAQLALNEAEARLAAIRRERALDQTTLALLTGDKPEDLHLPAATLRGSVSLQAPPEGLPSSLLERRPDLLAAEARRSSH